VSVSLDILPTATPAAARSSERAPPAIGLRGLSVRYGRDVEALRDVDLSVERGSHVVVLGASGSGKTTLLGVISRRIAATEGTVDVAGRVATIHQDLRLVKQRTALANVLDGAAGRYGLVRSIAGYPRAERQRATALLRRVGLARRMHARVGQLSGGEQQRVAIARALMTDPQVLLADEPVASLDHANARAILQLLCELRRERGITLVSVLHDCALAETFADRIIGFEHGRLVHDATACDEVACGAKPARRPVGLRGFERFEPCRACEMIEHEVEASLPQRRVATAPDEPAKTSAIRPIGWTLAAVATLGLYAWCFADLGLTGGQTRRSLAAIADFARQLLPTSWQQFRGIDWGMLGTSLVKTLQMAFVGTTITLLIAIPLSALAARNTGPRFLRGPTRMLLNAIRAVPSIVWAVLFVGAVGIGEEAGIWALVCYSLGYLTKFFYEAFEAVDPGPPDALREIGAGGLVRFAHAVWPASRAQVLSSSLFMFEYNVRAASVLGVVGAGGIGFELMLHKDYGNWHVVGAILLVLVVVVLVLDAISSRIRAAIVKG
jgi:phosphonate transport system permease protein